MEKTKSKLMQKESDDPIFNAFSHERFFSHEDNSFALKEFSLYVDKNVVIDEMLSANINEHTHKAYQE